MTKKEMEDYESSREVFYEESPTFQSMTWKEKAYTMNALHRYEKTLHRLSENACNGWPTGPPEWKENAEWREKDERKEQRTEERVREIAEYLGFKVKFNGDPRGGSICLILPSGRHNSWDGETWRIAW